MVFKIVAVTIYFNYGGMKYIILLICY